MSANSLELFPLKKARSNVPLLEHRDVRSVKQLACLAGESEHPFQNRELTVDLRIGRAWHDAAVLKLRRRLPLCNVRLNVGR